MEEKIKPMKKTQYVDEMDQLVIGTKPKPIEKARAEYNPMYGRVEKVAVPLSKQFGRYFKELFKDYDESPARHHGGRKPEAGKYDDWGYN